MAKLNINGVEKDYEIGTSFEEVVSEFQAEYDNLIALVIENNKIRELTKTVTKDANIKFVTLKESIGHKAYVRTATMILIKSMYDVFGKDVLKRVQVEYAIGEGYYVEVKFFDENKVISQTESDMVRSRMQELIDADLPIVKKSYAKDEAIKLFKENGMDGKVKLFYYRRSSSINVYRLEDYYDYYYGYMLPSTGYIKYYDVMQYEQGVMLLIPNRKNPSKIDFFEPKEKLFNTMKRANDWGEMMGIENVGELNDKVCDGSINDMILVAEALQERRIGEIAKEIVERGNVKFILIAGPSSSGKTSFSHRLSIQLRTYGMVPHPIGMDDYFVNREDTPRDENGDYDFECIEAIDTDRFNADMKGLLSGEDVELPIFNFKTGRREEKGRHMKLGAEDILVIEGIHGLNPKTSAQLPDESKFKIFISALTTLNIDDHNRIPTTDARMLRRMIRDARTRGASAKRTIQMWPSVRKGEDKNIFPYQESADVMFNSALIYEIGAMKPFAEPLLYNIKPGEPEYFEAQRMLKFLEYFLAIGVDNVPNNSLCREFVGGSYFNV